jgi:quinol monooxygenase YgiN
VPLPESGQAAEYGFICFKEIGLSKITLQGYIVVSNSDLHAIKGELQNHIFLTRKEKGCLIFEVTQDTKNKNIFNVYEEFVDRVSFEAHQKRVKNSRWGLVTKNIERHYQVIESE